jgi:Kef-type K+ transport system membrane component KefB
VTGIFIFDKYADENQSRVSFALFIGIVMSITAFPVLARIIRDKGLSKSHLGTISLASAATIDITAWCLLAVVIAIVQAGSIMSAVYNLLLAGSYIVVMFLVIRPFLRMVGQIYHNEEVITGTLVAFIFFILLTSAFLTDMLGLHILFGAFMAGIIMPPDIKFRKILTEKVESVSLYLLLPLFFVSIGLKTNFWLLNTPDLWILLLVFIGVAFTGKFVGALFSARIAGERWENSLYIGILLNTHGLMELVVLSIGYQMNIISPPIFAIMVLMTLLITFITSPLMGLVKMSYHFHNRFVVSKKQENPDSPFKLLLSFGRAGNGQIMLNVAHQMFSMRDNKMEVTALHFTLGSEINPLTANDIETVSFRPIFLESRKLNIPLNTQYNVSNTVGKGIATIANEGNYDFMLVGSGIQWSNLPNDIEAFKYQNSVKNRYLKPKAWFFPSEMMEDKTELFIEQVSCPVGVFINRDFVKASKVLLVLNSTSDLYLLQYAWTLLKFTSGSISIIDRSAEDYPEKEILNQHIRQFLEMVTKASLLTEKDIYADLLNNYNFMLISYVSWKDVSENRREILQKAMPSTLIISK